MVPESSLPRLQNPATCPYPEPDRSSPCPHPTSQTSIFIWSYLCLGFPSGLLRSGFPTKTKNMPLLSPIRAKCLVHLSLLDLITRITFGKEYKAQSSSLCSLLHFLVASCLLGPDILLSTLFSKTLSLRSSVNVRDHVLHPYKTTGKSIVLSQYLNMKISWLSHKNGTHQAHKGNITLGSLPILRHKYCIVLAK